jgi:diacylglycerol kinase family enzyme
MVAVALLSNPQSTGNRAILPRVRSWCATQPDIFHYEVEQAGQIGLAMASIALVRPRVIAINGGDGTVQAALTELYSGGHFPVGEEPPVAVLPNGKTNLIALDLGAEGDPLDALKQVVGLARGRFIDHVVQRELISLQSGDGNRPVLGMFLGGAGLAGAILHCRHKIYPLGLPNALSHALAALAAILQVVLGVNGRMFPPAVRPMTLSRRKAGILSGRFSLLIVTTLDKLLLNAETVTGERGGRMKMLAVDHDRGSVFRLIRTALFGKLGEHDVRGLHFEQGDEFRIEGERSQVILDGELFEAVDGRPITLRSTRPVPFLQIAA